MRRPFKVLLALILFATLGGCTLPYYWQAVGGQLSLMRQRVPIEEALADADLEPATRERLTAVIDLRQFAARELGLPDNGSYSTYVDLGRDYVVWNVIAAETFSVDPVQWCFPIAGCVSYRGYFDRADAIVFERRLAADGYDTYSGGSGAYSTLGYFNDPVLSTMLAGRDVDLAAILFHELAHQRVYIKGDSELSEAFASAVEAYGVEHLLAARGDATSLMDYRQRRRRADEFAGLVARQRERLAAIYADSLSTMEMLERKAAAFGRMRADYAALKISWGGVADYDGWFAGEMNNARLAAVSTYRKWLPGLRWRLNATGHEAFYLEIEQLAEQAEDVRNRMLERWNADSLMGGSTQSG